MDDLNLNFNSSHPPQVMPSTMKPYDFIPTSAFTDLGNVLDEAGSEKREEQLLPGMNSVCMMGARAQSPCASITFGLPSQANWSSATKKTSPRARTKSASALPLASQTTSRSSAQRYF